MERLENLPRRYLNQAIWFSYLIFLVIMQVLNAPSDAEEIPDPQLVDAELRGAHEGMESMRLLGGHFLSVASAAKDGPEDLKAVDNFQTTYLQPLRIFNNLIENLANVWVTLLGWKRAN
jgi:hypothetical protein